jgi:hypothetical protein
MARYFKYVSIREGKEVWMLNELKAGRARFGWSGADSDLNVIKLKPQNSRSPEEKVVWRYTQFLINRLTAGDRLIIQLKRPLRQILIAEVIGPYKSTTPQETDFNHYVECKLLTDSFVNIDTQAVSQSLRHHLSKRGHYYEIYDQEAKVELDSIVEKSVQKDSDFIKANQSQHSITFERDALEEAIITQTYERISKKWPSAYFEQFVADLIQSTPGLEVNKQGDTGQGWDLTMRILDPIDGGILHDDIPVQCKNYQGEVKTLKPIEDLERCSINSPSALAYLFIIGDLAESFTNEFEQRLEKMKNTHNEDIQWRVIGQEQIARLYLNRVDSRVKID